MAAASAEPVGALHREGHRHAHPAAGRRGRTASPGRQLKGFMLIGLDGVERLFQNVQVGLDHGLAPVETQADAPPAQTELLADGADHIIGQRAGLVRPLLAGGQNIGGAEPVADGRGLLQHAFATQRTDGVDERTQVLHAIHFDIEPAHHFRLRHQPHAGLGHDAEIRLDEQLIPGRPVAVLVQLPARANSAWRPCRCAPGRHRAAPPPCHRSCGCARRRACSPGRGPGRCR